MTAFRLPRSRAALGQEESGLFGPPPYMHEAERGQWRANVALYGNPVYQYPFFFWPSSPEVDCCGLDSIGAHACAVWNQQTDYRCVPLVGGPNVPSSYMEDMVYGQKKPERRDPSKPQQVLINPATDPALQTSGSKPPPRPVPGRPEPTEHGPPATKVPVSVVALGVVGALALSTVAGAYFTSRGKS